MSRDDRKRPSSARFNWGLADIVTEHRWARHFSLSIAGAIVGVLFRGVSHAESRSAIATHPGRRSVASVLLPVTASEYLSRACSACCRSARPTGPAQAEARCSRDLHCGGAPVPLVGVRLAGVCWL